MLWIVKRLAASLVAVPFTYQRIRQVLTIDRRESIPALSVYEGRKGARKVSEIHPELLQLLQQGRLETVNLTEWLAIDHITLLLHILDELGLEQHSEAMLFDLKSIPPKIMKMIPAIAGGWLSLLSQMPDLKRTEVIDKLSTHRSDSVRCWAAYIVGLDELTLDQKLQRIRFFAADEHFGVREIAWMAVREHVAQELKEAIRMLADWARDDNANIRRFAIEVTRPHGVWAKHIAALKENPGLALPLLDIVKSDPSKYVQDSVGNWLNDAAKSRPEWVIQTCQTWEEQSRTRETMRILRRAQRSFDK
ncbi:DNA alkylation repair protein [Paenibacillus sp. D2_2]|uniref:DNA alkylation repair protein n=1 Tax=Paenibacillus sp. D2_2 TaxID=3073092 RepID=UPI0028163743|nr:DNA alkylation repair protein [Paenibacillus sp. D2_2]WMT40109.1 DNA alkylation repair protein [Paenibacillus sp. D2_2]